MKSAKKTLPPYNDAILPALKAARRNPALIGQFKETLALSKIFLIRLINQNPTQGPTNGTIMALHLEINGEKQGCAACFSSPHHAMLAWAKIVRTGSFPGVVAKIEEGLPHKFFTDAFANGISVCLNYESLPEESYIFELKEVEDFLLTAPPAPEPPQLPSPLQDDPKRSRDLRRSKQGREVISTIDSKKPIDQIDFDLPKTKYQIAALFETSENEITKAIAHLDKERIVDVDGHRINLDDSPKAPHYYDALIIFNIGLKLDAPRGEEFRRWFTGLVYDFWLKEKKVEAENTDLKNQLESASTTIKNLELSLKDKDAAIEGVQIAASQLNQENLNLKRQIADLKNESAAGGKWELPESVAAAKQMAAERYGSKLVFHERVDRTIDDFSLNQNLSAAFSAARIFKALAENLHKAKFERQSFSEEQFRDDTGLIMSMTESKASKRDQAVWNTRTCIFKGEEITFFPHVKDVIQGVQFRVHFQFLDKIGKIIVCHVGDHLFNAQSQYL